MIRSSLESRIARLESKLKTESVGNFNSSDLDALITKVSELAKDCWDMGETLSDLSHEMSKVGQAQYNQYLENDADDLAELNEIFYRVQTAARNKVIQIIRRAKKYSNE